jgi:hypothetical protein
LAPQTPPLPQSTSISQLVPDQHLSKSHVESATSDTDSNSDTEVNNPLNQTDGACSDEEVQVGLQMLEAASHVQNQNKGLFIISPLNYKLLTIYCARQETST